MTELCIPLPFSYLWSFSNIEFTMAMPPYLPILHTRIHAHTHTHTHQIFTLYTAPRISLGTSPAIRVLSEA